MNSLASGPVADAIARLFAEAGRADQPLVAQFMAGDDAFEEAIADMIAAERRDLAALARSMADNYLAVSPEFGAFLYTWARGCRARRIVEFGTSMGISAIHLAAALHDMGGGLLIGTEIEPAKAARARANVAAAGLADHVEIRTGNALETLRDIEGPIDMVLLDGAFSLYLDVLKLLEPKLRPGAVIVAENAFAQADGYLAYVRDPANGYCSQPLMLNAERGNEFTVVTR